MTRSHRLVDRAFVITSLLLVILGIGAAFQLLGSPAQQRRVSLDEERVRDLDNIARQLKTQAQEADEAESKLPEQLPEALKFDKDPVTNEPYEYQRQSESTYALCATFATDSSEYARDQSWFDNQWRHPEGRYCYEIE
ncbi:MAG: hypothetical protein WBB01_24830, partial [Phormidesmis sp.]